MYGSQHQNWRRGYARGGVSRPSNISLTPERSLSEGLSGTSIKILSKPPHTSRKDIAIKQLEYIGSYSWTNATKPTMIVPGSPPLWRHRALPYSVPRDSGARFVDQNGYRMPTSTLYPLLRAVDIMAEDKGKRFDWHAVDFVTDRNGLRKLLRWINDNDGTAREFRIDTQLAGSHTVLFNRWETKTRENADLQHRSYGISFERESTTHPVGCEQATGHHRIVKYDFDGFIMVVRFEVDACLPSGNRPAARRPTVSANVDSLNDMLSGLAVTSGGDGANIDGNASTSELNIIRAGTAVPQDSIIEMTTRSRNYALSYDWTDNYPQLYLSQTPNHYLAVHNRGEFQNITKRALGDPEMKSIEAGLQDSFRRLRSALQTIQDLVVEHGEQGRLSLVLRNGTLQVFERKTQDSCLPETMLRRFEPA